MRAALALVVAEHAVHHLTVVPNDQVPLAPGVDVDEGRLGGMLDPREYMSECSHTRSSTSATGFLVDPARWKLDNGVVL